MIDYSCLHYDGDDDCKKCCVHGYIYSCAGCREYDGFSPDEHQRVFVDGDADE